MASILRFPKPRSLLHFISLRTATEFIHLTLLINKVTGLYGILALFTGYHLNPLQLSHYIYSLVILVLGAWLMPAIRRPDQPLRNVGLAWVYVMDTVVNGVYTGLFGAGWFVLLSTHMQEPGKDSPLGSGMMGDVAGFTDPEHNVTAVEVVAEPAPGIMSGQQAVAIGHGEASLGQSVLQSDSMTSIALLAVFTIVRIYFCMIVLSYARSILRQYIASTSNHSYSDSSDPTMAENPFREGREESSKLGRMMLKFPSKRYWLGREDSDAGQSEWERTTSGRFESGRKALRITVPEGVGERERRARSGTGPPMPKKAPE